MEESIDVAQPTLTRLWPAVVAMEANVDQISPAVELVDGPARTADDYAAAEFVGSAVSSDAVAWLDLDADGVDELPAFVLCDWGGSGWGNSIVALRATDNATTGLVASPLQKSEPSACNADELTSAGPGVLSAIGGERARGDAQCCPSSTVTDRWTFRDGEWTRL